MNDQDRAAIEDLFRKLGEVERQAGPRDAEAQALIDGFVRQQPASPYFMAQTIVMQNFALEDAQQRIDELERQLADRRDTAPSGGFLSSLFGGGRPQSQGSGSVPSVGARDTARGYSGGPSPAPMGQSGFGQARGGGGFLAGAAQTAMGVAGGVLLGNAVAGMFGSNPASATPASGQPASDQANDAKNSSAQDASNQEDEAAQEDEGDEGGFFDGLFGSDEEI